MEDGQFYDNYLFTMLLALEQISLLALSLPTIYAAVAVVAKQTAAKIAFAIVVVAVGAVGLRQLHMQASAKNSYNFQPMQPQCFPCAANVNAI